MSTEEHVFDSFNANDDRAMGVTQLMEAILAGKKTLRDLPLIRVAVKKGAYWCVDNRRLFVYKHCQLGHIPVMVYDWKANREFELKWKNGLATRAQTSEGRRVGVLQRTSFRFPQSPVMEPALSKVTAFLSPAEQARHDASILALAQSRKDTLKSRSLESGSDGSLCTAEGTKRALREVLSIQIEEPAGKRKKKTKGVKKRTKTAASGASNAAAGSAILSQTDIAAAAATFTVTMGAEDSGDEAYSVEVFAPS